MHKTEQDISAGGTSLLTEAVHQGRHCLPWVSTLQPVVPVRHPLWVKRILKWLPVMDIFIFNIEQNMKGFNDDT